MRVDSWELPLSAISLCQLLPCHLGLPRLTLSLNLYVKGCLDCTIGAFHVHTRWAFSLSEWGPDPQCQAAQVVHWTWWWQCPAAWHCRSVWSLPCHSAAALEVWFCQWPSPTGTEHCAPHTWAAHMAMHPEREAARLENWQQLPELPPGGFHTCCGWKFPATCCYITELCN